MRLKIAGKDTVRLSVPTGTNHARTAIRWEPQCHTGDDPPHETILLGLLD
jgi:hypothetical protein